MTYLANHIKMLHFKVAFNKEVEYTGNQGVILIIQFVTWRKL